jgi:hypothetical protein
MEVTMHDFQALVRRILEALQCTLGYLAMLTLRDASYSVTIPITLWTSMP